MAGHSKFKNIMYRKGAQDKKRSAMFSKLSPRDHRRGQDGPARSGHERAPARRGPRRQGAVDAQGQYPARRSTRPRAATPRITRRSATRASAPAASSLIVEALTDNRNRTATNVRTAFSKNGGNLGASGSVSHGFDRHRPDRISGRARATPTRCSKRRSRPAPRMSKATRTATRSGPRMDDLHEVARALEAALGEAESVKLAWRPQTDGRGRRRRCRRR